MPQSVLMFSAFLLGLLVFHLLLNTINIFFYIENASQPTHTMNFFSTMTTVSIGLWGFLLPAIFLMFGLPWLALAAAAVWGIILFSGLAVIWRPFEERRRSPAVEGA